MSASASDNNVLYMTPPIATSDCLAAPLQNPLRLPAGINACLAEGVIMGSEASSLSAYALAWNGDITNAWRFKRTSHAVYDTSYHLVWCPKYRKKIFERADIRERTERLICEISEGYGFGIIEMEVLVEHVHILICFAPRYSIGAVVRIIESNSAREWFREFAFLKRRLWAGELWEGGYFVRTVGDRITRDVIKRYIEHHRELAQGPAQLGFKLR